MAKCTFCYQVTWVVPDKVQRAVNGCVCVCVCVCVTVEKENSDFKPGQMGLA